jgi:hypothetical protein
VTGIGSQTASNSPEPAIIEDSVHVSESRDSTEDGRRTPVGKQPQPLQHGKPHQDVDLLGQEEVRKSTPIPPAPHHRLVASGQRPRPPPPPPPPAPPSRIAPAGRTTALRRPTGIGPPPPPPPSVRSLIPYRDESKSEANRDKRRVPSFPGGSAQTLVDVRNFDLQTAGILD